MKYAKKTWNLIDNYLLARLLNKPSTASFWYLPEPANLVSHEDLFHYMNSPCSPRYLLDYRQKLQYQFVNDDGIIMLPYDQPIGAQINPEAAFQYALGLHDQFHLSNEQTFLNRFMHYVDYFLARQTQDGYWEYNFDWYGSKAPWHSALAQARGSSVMLRAWKHSGDEKYLNSAKLALSKFTIPSTQGGFLHEFAPEKCMYFEEYPHTPTGVINGFMACLMNIWELKYWTHDAALHELWESGMHSLEKMLPHYTNGWWSLYDLDKNSPIANVNSPRYHLLEMNYLKILATLSESAVIEREYARRSQQYHNLISRAQAFSLKIVRKILYR